MNNSQTDELINLCCDNFDRAKAFCANREADVVLKDYRKRFKYICIFACGNLGRETFDLLNSYNVKADFYCDNNYPALIKDWNEKIPLISFEELCKIKEDCLVFVSLADNVTKHNQAVNEQLENAGFKHVIHSPVWKNMLYFSRGIKDIDKDYFLDHVKAILETISDQKSFDTISAVIKRILTGYGDFNTRNSFSELYDPNQYFPDFIELSKEERFVDCGAYTGDTFEEFLKHTDNEFGHYYGFELFPENFVQLKEHVSLLTSQDKVSLFPYGVYSESKDLFGIFNKDGSRIAMGEKDTEAAQEKLQTITLDECLKGEKITYLKMDIEDSEVPALMGARELITTQKPKCAISMYHSLKQFLEIPEILKQMNPEYEFRYRMHSTVGHDIVCYAINSSGMTR